MANDPSPYVGISAEPDDGVDTHDTDRIDYAAEFLRKLRVELRAIGTALGAAENSLGGTTPYQRRTLLIGLAEVFGSTGEMFRDAREMIEGFLVQMDQKPSVK